MLAVIFRISDARYAIPCERIIEVIPLVVLRAEPRAPTWVLGSFVYRGALTPVLDLCQLMGGYPCPKRLSSRVILTECTRPDGSSIRVGLLAEHVTEARRLNGAPLSGTSLGSTPYLGAVLQEGGSLLQIVHADRVLLGSETALAELFSHGSLAAGETDRTATQP
jgi:chemotaxis-related protein WspB